jgi:16S rRNA processing protein RimM
VTSEPARRLEVGRVAKPHGLAGEVIVDLTTTETSRLDPGSVLHLDDRPLTVRRAERHQRRWIVDFAEVHDRHEAEAIAGAVLRADVRSSAGDDPDALWAHELIGARVVDLDGTDRGEVVALVDNPASDLLELDSGHLVPLRFVVGPVEHVADVAAEGGAGRRVRIDPPTGLLD